MSFILPRETHHTVHQRIWYAGRCIQEAREALQDTYAVLVMEDIENLAIALGNLEVRAARLLDDERLKEVRL